MRFSPPENSTVQQVQQVQQGATVAAVGGHCNRALIYKGCCSVAPHRTTAHPEPWPPSEYAVPATVKAIEAGRTTQAELFREQPDDSREGRLARLTTQSPRRKRG